MKKLEIPLQNVDVTTIFQDCNNDFTKSEKHKNCNKYINIIKKLTDKYENNVPNNISVLNQDEIFKDNSVDKDLLIDHYNDQFVKNLDIRKKYYDVIMKNAKGVCPICGSNTPRTLDHYLPKTKYPLLCLSPINLIPCCRDCNESKRSFNSELIEENPIHPYLEEINVIWLNVDIHFYDDNSFDVVFKNTLNDPAVKTRLDNQIKIYDLSTTLSAKCITELNSNKEIFKELLINDSTANLLKKQICDIIKSSESMDINYWKSALYRGILIYFDEFKNWIENS